MNLWLVVERDREILEGGVLAWSSACIKGMLPRRDPDHESKSWKKWVIDFENRRAFGAHVDKILAKKKSCTQEELYGFFLLVGMGTRWADDEGVRWILGLADDDEELN